MVNRAVLSLIFVALSFGCTKDSSESEPSTKASEPEQPDDEGSAGGNPEATFETLPPIDLAVAEPGSRKTADDRNRAGLAKQRAGDYDAAVALYREAVAADPSHVLARYNLASAHSKAGHREQALAMLRQIGEVPDCAVCQGRLVRAQKDPDFESLREDDEFVSITSAAKVEELTTKQASKRFLRVLDGVDQLPAYLIHPRNPVRLEALNGQCDPVGSDDCTSSSTAIGADAVMEALDVPVLLQVEVGTCDADCCKLTVTDPHGGDVAVRLDELCWSADSGGVRTLRRVAMTDAP